MSRSSASAPERSSSRNSEFMLNYCLCESILIYAILIYESQVGQQKKCCREDSSFGCR